MKSGDKIKTLAGTEVEEPYSNEHPCFGQRQEPKMCNNMSTWRLDGKHLHIHWCDDCKSKLDAEHKFDSDAFVWTRLEERPI
jgi:hypothetical protein